MNESRLEGDLEPWLVELWKTLLQIYPLPSGQEVLPSGVLYPRFCLLFIYSFLECLLLVWLFSFTIDCFFLL